MNDRDVVVVNDGANWRSGVAELAAIVKEWKPAKQLAARYLAIGCTQQYAAEKTDTPHRTLQHWIAEPEFHAWTLYLRDVAVAQIETDIAANVRLALEVQAEVMRGDLSAKSDRYRVADKLLYRFVDRLVAIEAGPAAPDGAPVGPTVVIQNAPGYDRGA